MLGLTLRLAIVGLAVAAALIPLDRAMVERVYSRSFYLDLQAVVTPLSDRVPFALIDLVGALVLITIGVLLFRVVIATRRLRAAARLIAGTIVGCAVAYLIFLGLWGLNYRRLPLTDRLDYDETRVHPGRLVDLATDVAARMNQLRRSPAALEWLEMEDMHQVLGPAFEETQRLLGQRPAVPSRPKWSILSPYFRWAGVDGMMDPFFLEILVRHDLLPFERPFVVAHEWAHLAGYADESEASFVGWLTCLRSESAARYSAWMFLYVQLDSELDATARARVTRSLESVPRSDLEELARKFERETLIQAYEASRAIYDRFLKANRVEEGIASYNAVVGLVLGTRFRAGFVPTLRDAEGNKAVGSRTVP